jgi:hypothetical protein
MDLLTLLTSKQEKHKRLLMGVKSQVEKIRVITAYYEGVDNLDEAREGEIDVVVVDTICLTWQVECYIITKYKLSKVKVKFLDYDSEKDDKSEGTT